VSYYFQPAAIAYCETFISVNYSEYVFDFIVDKRQYVSSRIIQISNVVSKRDSFLIHIFAVSLEILDVVIIEMQSYLRCHNVD
jgi:hypothetical protein